MSRCVTPIGMKLAPVTAAQPTETETVDLSYAQYEALRGLSHDLNPDTPMVFGGAHAVRTLLDRIEETGIDLSDASSEDEIVEIATAALRRRRQR